jgi:hypothetical protein
LNEAFSIAVSERALINSGMSAGFFVQAGISPQRARSAMRSERFEPGGRCGPAVTTRIGWVGATL